MTPRRPAPIVSPQSCLDHRPGHEVVFAELVNARTVDAAGVLREASRLYSASAQPGIELPEWAGLGAATVRIWVRVAREARTIHEARVRTVYVPEGALP